MADLTFKANPLVQTQLVKKPCRIIMLDGTALLSPANLVFGPSHPRCVDHDNVSILEAAVEYAMGYVASQPTSYQLESTQALLRISHDENARCNHPYNRGLVQSPYLLMMRQICAAGSLLACLPLSFAQFFPQAPTGLTNTTSKVNSKVKISYKETTICDTTTAYGGYVYLPGSILSDVGGFDINTYFLYVKARHNASTAPLAIYLAGGPGESSIYTALASESGPCYVNTAGNDTTLNPWAFNNYVNMLFIDQPVQTGFSFDKLVNGTFNLTDEIIRPLAFNASTAAAQIDPLTSWGTFPSQDPAHTTNTSVSSARAVWHFAEHWLASFPPYATSSSKISFWANSYGGQGGQLAKLEEVRDVMAQYYDLLLKSAQVAQLSCAENHQAR
ncbi:hypothetical protein PV04_05969 [Phialophora macrospora]|uniref:Carboxypeptidase n=1 Tax=Phialophora macrospora TaxID=1851006 RepID=A0A0D2FF46_9EURO|nr:hypothetical protein PV04_05969 [Phialophora macrospora]